MHRIAPDDRCLTIVIAAFNEAEALPALQPRIATALKLAEAEGLPLVPLCPAALLEETLDLLAVMFDAYEDGPDCYEDPDEYAGHIGKAVQLDEATFDRIADLLNEHRPRNAGEATPNG